MFMTSDKSGSPRVFQKPNILRKKPKAKEKPSAPAEAPAPPESAGAGRHHCSKPCHTACKPPQRIRLDSYICEEYRMKKLQGGGEAAPEPDAAPAPAPPPAPHILSAPQRQVSLPFTMYEEPDIIYASRLFQGKYKVDLGNEYLQTDVGEMKAEGDSRGGGGEGGEGDGDYTEQWELTPFISFDSHNTWSIQLCPSAKERLASPCSRGGGEADAGAPAEGAEPLLLRLEDVSRLSGSLLTQHRSAPHKCDHEGCSKTFTSSEGLAQHRATHARRAAAAERSPATPPRQLSLDCPARRLNSDPPLCDAVFQCREDLARHLSEDHTEEEAPYKCDTCGRVFFWCSGLRAHMRAHERPTRMLFACLWPGCSRVFLQACRLKEHSRAHTGDKPYACLYPNCGWAFRTASKLMRHRRRHTDERRFPCALCGRAFLRPEHLREHAVRHTHPLYRHKHPCTVPGCEQKFTNKSSLYLHMKKVHPPPAPSPPSDLPVPTIDFESVVVASPPAEECRAARTHVTWPLPPGAHRDSPASDDDALDMEGGVYTVRSDLFLHGNTALHHDDTQQCLELVLLGGGGGGAEEERGGGGGYADSLHLDTDLDLLDSAADPINHLLQEELMLAGAGVDESPFQVLLLSEEEVR